MNILPLEFNLRERAEIVSLAIDAEKKLKAQELIDYFNKKYLIENENLFIEFAKYAKTYHSPRKVEDAWKDWQDKKLKINIYSNYVGCYAKRFYTAFEEEHMFKINDFQIKNNVPYFEMKYNNVLWLWDVEDCVIITNELPIIVDERIANVNDPQYIGYNPFFRF